MPSIGRFWAVGVGPGDAELLTLRALRILQAADVVYHAGPEPTRGRAYEIVAAQLRPDQQVRCALTASMTAASASDWRQVYRPAVEAIASDCRAGRNVAFITEGDPTLYSTAAYVWQLLSELHLDLTIEVVPGVTSITAAAARALTPLVQKDETLAIVPAHYHTDAVSDWLQRASAVAFLKPTAALGAIAAGLGERDAVYLENVGRGDEYLTRDLHEAAGRDCYFSLVLAPAPVRDPRAISSEPPASAGGAQVTVVGLGPGALDLLTPRALRALRSADVIVGYDAYLPSLAPLQLRAELRGCPIGAELERARLVLDLAGQGRRVVLVSSGDAGVYGMASLLLETAGDMEVDAVPGVTAATAAASLLGAPLGHDFACISLSDLLTPWPAIERRLEAAGRGDLVVALYNPLSLKRTWQLPRAREILLQHRRLETPVGVVDRAYRAGSRTWLTTLGDFTSEGIGMETLIIVGSSQTRVLNGRLVTPRGYLANEQPTRGADATPLGRHIMDESFAIIDRELGDVDLPPWARAVVRRMIHASADFEFVQLLRYSSGFEDVIRAALGKQPCTIVTDTEMVREGIRTMCRDIAQPACHLNDPATQTLAEQTGLTRSAAGIRLAAQRHPHPIVAIGNAPTALEEALRLVREEEWRPVAIVGMPVGFVGVIEAKRRLLAQSAVPYLTCEGRKGGSAVTAAAVNALLDWCQP